MDINMLDIKNLREESERDLEALQRVEAMLHRQRNGRAITKASAPLYSQGKGMESNQNGANSGNVGVKARVGEIVRQAGEQGILPREVVDIMKGEFTFKNRANAVGAVGIALSRFRKHGTVSRTDQGRYFWKGRDELSPT